MIPMHRQIKIVPSPELGDLEDKDVTRTWKERLFSWPWEPWKVMKTVQVFVPSKEVIIFGENTILCHPDLVEPLVKAIKDGEEAAQSNLLRNAKIVGGVQ